MNRMFCRIAVLAAALLAGTAPGRSGPTRLAEMTTPLDLRQVALFKNGLGFFVGQAVLPAGETSVRFLLPAAPSHGTFWLSYPPQVRLTSIVARKVKVEGETHEAMTILEILKANMGREVQLTVQEKVIFGRVVDVTEGPGPIRPLSSASAAPAGRPEIVPLYEPGLVILDVDGGRLCLDPRTIRHVLFPAGEIQRRFADTMETVEVRVQTDGPTDGLTLTVSFLARGITWAPSYLVDLGDEGRARLSAKALIINETYDLRNVATQLVTGFPHVKFADIFSPVGLEQSLPEFLRALAMAQPQGQAVRHRVLAMAPQAEAGFGGPASAVPPAYGAAEAGVSAEDLFLYPAGRITLAKDRVAYVPLFTESVPCEQLYKWTIPATTAGAGRFVPTPPSDQEEEQEIWHTLRLRNTTRTPWATAPAETVKDNILLGQDTLAYTPPGAQATLRITRALDVKGERQEREIDRTRNATQVNKVQYDLVTVRGELSVTNFRREPIALEITKTVSGEVQSTDPQAKIEKLAAGLQAMNPLAKLTWTLNLDPGGKRQVTYTYQVYVHP
jgi:hypothetical protein